LKAVEALKSRINTVDQGVAELVKPLPTIVVKRPAPKPKKKKPIEVVIDEDGDAEVKDNKIDELKDVLDEKEKAVKDLTKAIKNDEDSDDEEISAAKKDTESKAIKMPHVKGINPKSISKKSTDSLAKKAAKKVLGKLKE